MSFILIHFPDGPANCSNGSVVPVCRAKPIAEDDMKTDILVTLSSTCSYDLMCVMGYRIQFNGESRNVSLDSPSANFIISTEEGQPFSNKIVVYTMDYENRTGQIPCAFKVAGKFAESYFI